MREKKWVRKGQRPFSVKKKTKIGEDHPEVSSEGADDLTLRAEEVDTFDACINVDHVGDNFCGPPLVNADWHAFSQASHGGLKEVSGKSCIILTKR